MSVKVCIDVNNGFANAFNYINLKGVKYIEESKVAQLQKEIDQLKKIVEVLEETNSWIARTDITNEEPHTLWLTNWRNTRKQAAQEAQRKVQEIRNEGG